jgi:hypothetical protein
MPGYPGAVSMGWNFPVAGGFYIGAVALAPFRCHPYVVGRGGFRTFDNTRVRLYLDIHVLCFGLQASEYQGGTKKRRKDFSFHSIF